MSRHDLGLPSDRMAHMRTLVQCKSLYGQELRTSTVVLAIVLRCIFQQPADRPSFVRKTSRHRRRPPLQGFMLPAEVVPREENRLHRYVVLW